MTDSHEPALTEETLDRCARQLAQSEPFFAGVLARHGTPPLWKRPAGFATLVWIILEQQVSLASARAAYHRLTAQTPELTPQNFLQLDDATLFAIGFSRQKRAYCRGLAQAIASGELNLESLAYLTDQAAHAGLTKLKGIGCWTADIYLLMALGRPNIWPAQDLALVTAVQHGLNLDHKPSRDEIVEIAEPWQPYRSVAARFFLALLFVRAQASKRSSGETS